MAINVTGINNYNPQLLELLEQFPVGVLLLDAELRLAASNQAALHFGVLADAAGEGKQSGGLFKEEKLNGLAAALTEGSMFEQEAKSVSRLSGDMLSIVVKGAPLYEKGEFTGAVIIIEDLRVTAEKKEDVSSGLSSNALARLLATSCDALILFDEQFTCLFHYGSGIERISGGTRELQGKPIEEIIASEEAGAVRKFIASSAEQPGERLQLTVESDTESTTYTCRAGTAKLPSRAKNIYYLHCFDITDINYSLRQLSGELEELRQYQVITETTADAVVGLTTEGKVNFWNKAAEKLFGYSRSQVYDKSFGPVIGAYNEEYFSVIRQHISDSSFFKTKLPFANEKTGKRTGSFRFHFTTGASGEPFIVALCSDITEDEERLARQRVSQERYRHFADQSSEMMFACDETGKIFYTNRAFRSKLGYTEAELRTLNVKDLVDNRFLKNNSLQINEIAESAFSRQELIFVGKNNDHFKVSAEFRQEREQAGSATTYQVALTDVTMQKKTEEQLSMMKAVFDNTIDGIAIEKDKTIIMANEAFALVFGYTDPGELKGKDLLEMLLDNGTKKEDYQSFTRGDSFIPSSFDFLARRRDGGTFYAEISTSAFNINNQHYVIILARDVTERKEAQVELRDSEERYRSITENIDDFFWIAENKGGRLKVSFVTASIRKIAGYSRTEVYSDNKLFFKIIHPDDLPHVKKKLRTFFQNFYKRSESIELRVLHKQGISVWVRNKLSVVRDRENNIEKIYGLVSDISLQKKAEEEVQRYTDNLQQLNDTKDRFISIVSHDMRTPFSSILGFTDLMLGDDDITMDEMKQYAGYIRESTQSMLSLVNSLLDWTRLQTGRIRFEPRKIGLSTLVGKSIKAVSGTAMQKNIDISHDLDDEYFVFVDEGLMMQVFTNLFSNALKFTSDGGRISIRTLPAGAARFIKVAVSDTGIGIKEADLGKLFNIDSKYTTEGTRGEKGTGFGLSLVKEIVDKHGGTISVESTYGEGTTFTLSLPKASATILLVDDSNTDRILYSKILKNFTSDYEIETMGNMEDALDAVLRTAPALVVTDHIMPGKSGFDLVESIMDLPGKERPEIIVLSADIGKSEILAYNEMGINYVFHKPVNLASFKSAVEKCLKKIPR